MGVGYRLENILFVTGHTWLKIPSFRAWIWNAKREILFTYYRLYEWNNALKSSSRLSTATLFRILSDTTERSLQVSNFCVPRLFRFFDFNPSFCARASQNVTALLAFWPWRAILTRLSKCQPPQRPLARHHAPPPYRLPSYRNAHTN